MLTSFTTLFSTTVTRLAWAGVLTLSTLASANTESRITITKNYGNATSIAVVPFVGSSEASQTISEVITQDLNRSGKFSSNSNLPQTNIANSQQITPSLWSAANSPFIVLGAITNASNAAANDLLTISFELVDTSNFSRKLAEQMQIPPSRLRDAGHLIADKIFESITGVKGDFSGKIAYVLTSTKNNQPYYQLQVADTDGARPQVVFASTEPLMSPTWSPDGTSLAYVSFEKGQANVFMQNVYSAQRSQLTNFAGFSSAPAFSPDGQYMLFTSSMQGNADIYQMRLSDKSITPLISHTAIDTEGSYSPDGKSVIFTSDRGGTPQIYQLNLANRSTKRLSFEGNFNGKAIMSNDLRSVALIHNSSGNRYQMSILDIDSGIIQVLSPTFSDESPAFSPNGSMIAFGSSHQGKGVLAIVSSDGQFSMRLPSVDGTISEPAWCPKR